MSSLLAAAPAAADADRLPIQNEILLGLSRKERALVISKSEFVARPIESCYFLNSGVASIIPVMNDGKSVEVGLTGKEGFVGLPLVAWDRTSPTRAIVQIEATGHKMRPRDLKNALGNCPGVEESLHRYSHELAVQAIQITACNRLHEVDERLARWLLMSQDRLGNPLFL